MQRPLEPAPAVAGADLDARLYLVFSQSGAPRPADVASAGIRFLDTPPTIEEIDGGMVINGCMIRWRDARETDWQAAKLAEARGHAAGMALLARRCRTVWELHATDDATRGFWQLCAGLAGIALGPILPPDGTTLYGIKSSLGRADKA